MPDYRAGFLAGLIFAAMFAFSIFALVVMTGGFLVVAWFGAVLIWIGTVGFVVRLFT